MKIGSEVNPLLPGTKEMCIFGFCDIRNFTDVTEELREGVMLFVNEIGEIVHSTVHKYSGAANKNVGDAFLLVWKFDHEDIYLDVETGELDIIEGPRVSQLADMSLISFLLLASGIRKSKKMVKYRKN